MMPVRVLHVLEATAGGTMHFMENIAEAIEGVNVTSAFAYGLARADSHLEPFLAKIRSRGWYTFPIKMCRQINACADAVAIRELGRAIKLFSPDILHLHSSKAGGLGRLSAALHRSSAIRLYSPHALASPLGSKYLKIERWLTRYTDRFVAVSESERQEMIRLLNVSAASVDVVYPSIDPEYFAPMRQGEARRRLGLGDNPLVVSIGRLTLQKDPMSFIQIVRRLHEKRRELRGVWIGSGEGEEEFREQVKAAGLGNVVSVVPWMHDVREYIAAADVLLSTSRFESFGYVTAEALSMLRPVVASAVTGTRDIMTERLQKWMYPRNDFDHAARLLDGILTERGEASELAEYGRSLVIRRFSVDAMRERLTGVYTTALMSMRRHGTFPSLAGDTNMGSTARSHALRDDAPA